MRTIEQVLRASKTVAVVGLSPNPERESHRVAAYLQSQGYRIIPVNPNAQEVLGERCYATLSAVPEGIDVVDIFRRSEDVPPIVDEAIGVGAKVVWMQLGIVNEEAAAKARQHGLDVFMDRCMLTEHQARIARSSTGSPLP
ncbi:MAG: CoA-binding protein [Chloroflexi bacterium]|nr:CoA-binding protein [Chloroflexota bacterium]